MFVEIFVLLFCHVFFRTRPQCRGFVDGFPFTGLDHAARLAAFAFVFANQFAIFPLFFFHQDGQADVVGVFANDFFELPRVGVLQRIFAQMQNDAGAAMCQLDVFNFKIARTTTDPAHTFGCRRAGAARFHCDLVGHNETRIEAHAKLTNELCIGLLIARELAHKVLGTALGNGAQIIDGFLSRHANAVVGNGQGLGLGVK